MFDSYFRCVRKYARVLRIIVKSIHLVCTDVLVCARACVSACVRYWSSENDYAHGQIYKSIFVCATSVVVVVAVVVGGGGELLRWFCRCFRFFGVVYFPSLLKSVVILYHLPTYLVILITVKDVKAEKNEKGSRLLFSLLCKV